MTAQPLPELTEAILRPVRGHHAFEACVEQLATAIRLGVYPLGSTLPPERELAERMAVSRATVREAIVALRSARLVETRRGRGGGTVVTMKPKGPSSRAAGATTVAQRADWLDALSFRRIVEPGGAAQAAGAELDTAARARLESARQAVSAATSRARHRQADSRFHLTVASLSGSARTVEAVTSVQASLHDMLSAIPVLQTNISHSNAQHAALVRAVLSGQPERAHRVMEEHCDDTAALLRGLLA